MLARHCLCSSTFSGGRDLLSRKTLSEWLGTCDDDARINILVSQFQQRLSTSV